MERLGEKNMDSGVEVNKAKRKVGKNSRSLPRCISIILLLIMLPPMVSAAKTFPESCKIEGVPLYQQQESKGCGAASLQMVFDYYGPFIDQMEIYDAARSGGTSLPDIARAAQFSNLSTTEGDRFQSGDTTGYRERALGYAAFYYASDHPWLDQLKNIITRGYPVIVLVNWLPNVNGPHYRVVTGYDDTEGVLMMNDPWSREFKNDMTYKGSTSQSANPNAWDAEFGTFNMTYEEFLNVWALSTAEWGVPGLAYGAVFVSPWEVQIGAPEIIEPSKPFAITAKISYTVMAPFGSTFFPTFQASNFEVMLEVEDGLTICGSSLAATKGTLNAGQVTIVNWKLIAGNKEGTYTFKVTATGIVSGYLDPWLDYPSYNYSDMIGTIGLSKISVGK